MVDKLYDIFFNIYIHCHSPIFPYIIHIYLYIFFWNCAIDSCIIYEGSISTSVRVGIYCEWEVERGVIEMGTLLWYEHVYVFTTNSLYV